MGRPETLAAVREKFPVYKDMPDDQLAEALAAKYPQYQDLVTKKAEVPRGEGDKATGPTTPESIQRGLFGAGQPEPLNMLQRVGNAVLPPLVAAPAETALTGGGGALATKLAPQFPRLAAGIGRSLTAGALGGAEAAAQGKSPVGRGLMDAGIAATFEALLGARIPKVTSGLRDVAAQVTGKREQFQRATDAVDAAFDAIAARLPQGKFLFVPALSAKKLSADEARAALKKAEGATYDAARKQIHAELLAMDKRAGKSPAIGQDLYTAKDFGAHTLKGRFTPPLSGSERFAESAVGAMESPANRATVDVAASQDPTGSGIPAGALPLLGVARGAGSLWDVARHLSPLR